MTLFRNHKLLSLWEMLRFYADKFMAAHDDLSALRAVSVGQLAEKSLALDNITRERLNDLSVQLEAMGLPLTLVSVKRLIGELDKGHGIAAGRLEYLISDIQTRMEDELKNVIIFVITEDTEFYDAQEKWKTVADKYPHLTEDIDEAGKCLALGRYTAAVFHLMRIMEGAIRLIAKDLSVPDFKDKQWSTISGDIEKEIEKRWPCHGKKLTPPQKKKRQRYNEYLAYLKNVRIAWRNEVMHPKATYTPEEARAIYVAVQAFIAHMTRQ